MHALKLALLLCAAALLQPRVAAASRARDCGPSGQCAAPDDISLGSWGDGWGGARGRRLSCSGCPSECSSCTTNTCTGCRTAADTSYAVYVGVAIGVTALVGIWRYCVWKSRQRSSPMSAGQPGEHGVGMNPVMVHQLSPGVQLVQPGMQSYPGMQQGYPHPPGMLPQLQAYPGQQPYAIVPPPGMQQQQQFYAAPPPGMSAQPLPYPPQYVHAGPQQQHSINVKYGQE